MQKLLPFCLLLLCSVIVSCGSIEKHRNIQHETDTVLTTSIGGTIFRLDRTSDLPNVFGNADIYGGQVDRGYAEVKYKGLNEKGELIIQVIDVHTESPETVLDRYGNHNVNVNQNVNISQNATHAGTPEIFAFDLSKENELIIANVKIIFISVKTYSVTYKLVDLQK